MDLHEIWYLSIYQKTVKKIQVSLKSDNNNWYFTWRPWDFWSHLPHFLEWELFQTEVVEVIKTHIVCPVHFFLYRALYEMWKNIVQWGRPQMTIWCMRIAYWISKVRHTLTIRNTSCFFTATVLGSTRLNVTLYIHCLSCCNMRLLPDPLIPVRSNYCWVGGCTCWFKSTSANGAKWLHSLENQENVEVKLLSLQQLYLCLLIHSTKSKQCY